MCELCVYVYAVPITLQLCELHGSTPPPPALSGTERVMSVNGIDVHTALTAKVLNLLKKTLYMNFFRIFYEENGH